MNNEFDRPLIVFKENTKGYYFYENQRKLGICNYQAIKEGFFNDMIIFTIKGNSYRIQKVEIIKYRLWPLFYWLLGSPIVELRFIFILTPSLFSFNEFKNKLVEFLKTDSYFRNVGSTKEIVSKTRSAKNFHELYEIFDYIK